MRHCFGLGTRNSLNYGGLQNLYVLMYILLLYIRVDIVVPALAYVSNNVIS